MRNFKALIGEFTEKLDVFFEWVDELYPSKKALPSWMPPILVPLKFDSKNVPNKNIRFNLTENVCGLTANFGFIKRGVLHNCVVYDKNNKQIPEVLTKFPKIQNALANIRRDYNTNEVILQAKILEDKNYYNVMPKVLAFALYIDGIEQRFKDMAEILREYNIEIVPVIDLDVALNEKTKENYSAQSLLSNVPSKGIICTNRQKSLSFLL